MNKYVRVVRIVMENGKSGNFRGKFIGRRRGVPGTVY
jgi:hypothetical protein